MILTTYYNPCEYKTRKDNYDRFKEELGHDLLTIECAFDTDPFTLKDSIKLRSQSVLWMKERLLMIGERLLPRWQDYVVFLDCDILFENKNWLKDVRKKLKESPVVQPFKTVHRRNKDWSIEGSWESFGSAYRRGVTSNHFDVHGHTGFAYACRREVFTLYDRSIAGTGDHLLYHAAAKQIPHACINRALTGKRAAHFYKWAQHFGNKTNGQVDYVDGEINHLFHGSLKNRNYLQRMIELEKMDFDPVNDLYTNESGLLELKRKDIQDWVRIYFDSRKEDEE